MNEILIFLLSGYSIVLKFVILTGWSTACVFMILIAIGYIKQQGNKKKND